jgi:hypothetical protein
MKIQKLFLSLCLLTFLVTGMSQAPTKLFDVKNGNGIVDNGVAQPQATYIVFKNAAAKQAIIDSFATAYDYQATVPDPANPGQTIPNPQSKQAFFNRRLTLFIRDVHKSEQVKVAAKTATDTASAAADADLP